MKTMNRRTFLSIITFTLTFLKGGASLKTNDIEDNALRDGNTEVDAGGNRNNHVVEPIGKKYRHDSFYDFEKWGFDEKLDMVKSIQALQKTSSIINWDEMRDNYLIQVLNDLDVDGSSDRIIEESKARRRLSSETTDNRVKRVLQGKKVKKVKKTKTKKKKKKKDDKSKGKRSAKTLSPTFSPTSSPIADLNSPAPVSTITSMPSASPSERLNCSKKSKGKSKKALKKKTNDGGWCIIRPSDSDPCDKSKGKSKKYKYKYSGTGRERALKTNKLSGIKGFFKGKTMKIKKKKSKGSKESPSSPSSHTSSPASIDYGKGKSKKKKNDYTRSPSVDYGKGKSKKHKHLKYPYCDELSVTPNTSGSPSISMSPSERPSDDNSGDTPSPTESPGTPNPNPNPPPATPVTPNPTPSPTFIPTKNPTLDPAPRTPRPTISPKPTPEQGIYRYDSGACPASGSLGVPCAQETNIRKVCDRYDEVYGSFRECWNICRPSFCCIHDADPNLNYLSPSCSSDENCAQYAYCYIVWFKFHDTFGPATFINVQQEGNFFDVDNSEVRGDKLGEEFFDQLYFHHFDDVQTVIEDGSDPNGDFDLDVIFEDPLYWDNTI